MATVNKDFKIKSGLVVEGTNATVNGNQVLTETASDTYILNLIGGETLVKSVSGNLSVDNAGDLSIDQEGLFDTLVSDGLATETFVSGAITTASSNYDAAGSATTAENNAKGYADSLASNYDSAGSATTAENNAKGYADSLASNYDASGSASTAEQNAKNYADGLATNYDPAGAAGAALEDANAYTDNAVSDLVGSAPALLDTLQELATALDNNPDVITNLQDLAAGKQDTLTAGEGIYLDGATITGRQQAGGGLKFVYEEAAIDRTVIDAWYDASGAASTAEGNANSYTDNQLENYTTTSDLDYQVGFLGYAKSTDIPESTDELTEGVNNLYYTDARAKAEAKALLLNSSKTNIEIVENLAGGINITAENGVADSTTDDLAEGEGNLYFTDQRVYNSINGGTIEPGAVTINNFRKEEVTQNSVANVSTVNVHSFTYPYESAKYLVRVVGWDGGVKHSQITEILMTIDGNENIAMTEYGNVHTSTNPLASFSAAYNSGSGDFSLTATTAVSGCEIIVAATLLSWAD